jgi:PKD repeat protein
LEEAFNWSADPTNPFVVPDAAWPGLPTGENLALMKTVAGTGFSDLALAVDGDETTCAVTPDGVTGSITVDLGASCSINRVVAKWLKDYRFPIAFTVHVSPNNQDWTLVSTKTRRDGGIDDCYNLSATGRYVKLTVTQLGSLNGVNLHELGVYGSASPRAPEANFRGTPTIGNAPLTVNFTDLSNWTPTSWSWTFGDSGVSSAQNPSHQYTSTGTYPVSLTATNSSGQDTETKTGYVTVTTQNCHVAAISLTGAYSSKTGYYATATVTVHNQNCAVQSGVTVNGVWNGNDRMAMLTKVPASGVTNTSGQVTFTSPKDPRGGLFQFYVEGLSLAGYPYRGDLNHVTSNSIYYPTPQAPIAEFLGSPTTGSAPLTVSFTDKSFGSPAPTSWSWNFGDGGTSTAQNPSHQYTSADYYTVTLTVTSSSGQDVEMKTSYITVVSTAPPVANFSGNPTSGSAPLTVNFTDSSTNSPTSWSWSFGDGGTSTAQNPSHQYTSANQYTVSLTATNAYGSDGETKTNYITVTAGQPPVANFSGNPTSGAAPLTVNFTDSSTNSPTSWSWSFGDGGTSTAQNPSHQYTTANQYTVSLTATNAYGSDGETKTNYITVTGGGAQDYFCNSATILVGNLLSGDHTSVHASDDVYLVVEAVSSGNKKHADVEFTYNTGLGSLSSLSFTVESHVSVQTSGNRQVFAYNYSTSQWVQLSQTTVTGTDSTVQGDISSPSNYISGGTVRLRVDTLSTKTLNSHMDYVKITAAP